MKYVDTLASYLPSLIVQHLTTHDTTAHPPGRQRYFTVCVFADVSGFTALSEAMAVHGPEGAEYLAKHLNAYFGQMVRIIASEGGDIFKFAGDAMIVLWPDNDDDITTRIRRAGQSALTIQENLHAAELAEGVTLSVKIGIGVGMVSVLHLGGQLNRMEYVAVGEPLVQAFGAEHHAQGGGECIMSPAAWSHVSKFFEPEEILSGGYVRLKSVLKQMRRVNKLKMLKALRLDEAGQEVVKRLQSYVPGAVLPWLNPASPEEEVWGGDLRRVTCLFVNLGLKDHDLLAAAQYDDAMKRAHNVLVAVQQAVYKYEGSINKFLMDDKGSTLIAVFGLPPLAHSNDATRGVLAALAICDSLWKLKLHASVGITTGIVFCGVVGSTTRREYSVLGDTVNLSARLMQRACSTGGVLVNREIVSAASPGFEFQQLDSITVKGKTELIEIFRPYPGSVELPTTLTPGSEPSPYAEAYKLQQARYEHNALLQVHRIGNAPVIKARTAEETKADAAAAAAAAASAPPAPEMPRRGSHRGSNMGMRRSSGPITGKVLKKYRSLLTHVVSPYGFATVPSYQSAAVYLPMDYDQPDVLARPINYKVMLPLEQPLSLDDDAGGPATLLALRDVCVDKAKEAGKLDAMVVPEDFVVMIKDTDVRVPAKAFPIQWLSVVAWEMGVTSSSKRDGIMSLCLIKRRDLPGLMPQDTLVRQELLERKIDLVLNKQGSSTVIKGEAGTGKTHLLHQFINDVIPKKTSIFCATASPFQRDVPYGTWATIVQAALDEMITTMRQPNRTAVAMELLETHCADARLQGLGALLNEPLGVSIPTPAGITKLRKHHRDSAIAELMFLFVKAIALCGAAVIVIDNGYNLPAESWHLVHRVAAAASLPKGHANALPIMLVVSTRPVERHLDVVVRSVPDGYTTATQAPYILWAQLGRISSASIDVAVRKALAKSGWKRITVSEPVSTYLESVAMGNVLHALEVVTALHKTGKLVVSADAVKFTDAWNSTLPRCERPLMLQGMILDHLPPVQQVILKVGAVIGQSFKFETLMDVFPLDVHKPHLARHCQQMVDVGVLSRTDKAAATGTEQHTEIHYTFQTPFMQRSAYRRNLVVHRDKLASAITDAHERQKSQVRKVFLEKMIAGAAKRGNDQSGAGKSGWLTVRKNITQGRSFFRRAAQEWKRRWVRMAGMELRMFKEEDGHKKGAQPVQIVPLERAQADVVPATDLGKDNCFRITSTSWVKKGKVMPEPRTFYLSAESEAEAEDWVFWLKFLSERLQVMHKNKPGAGGDDDESKVVTEDNSMRGNRLVVTVVQGNHVMSARPSGDNRFRVSLALDSAQQTTVVAVDKGHSPVWNQLLHFPVSVQQAATGFLHATVWDDGECASRVDLGAVRIPLKSLTPLVVGAESLDECEAQQAAASPVVCDLVAPKAFQPDFYRGQITLRVRLLLSESAANEVPPLRDADDTVDETPLAQATAVAAGSEEDMKWLAHLRSAPARRSSTRRRSRSTAAIEYRLDDAVAPITSAIRRLVALQRLLGRPPEDDNDDDDEEYDSGEDDALPHDLDAEAFGSIDSLQAEVLCTQLAKVVDLMRTSRRRSSMIPAQGGSSFLDMVNLVDIDDQSKKWLSSQFTSETNGAPRPGSVGKALQPVVEGEVEADDGGNSEAASLGWRVDSGGSLVGAVEGELDVYYVDSEGETQGPFTLLQLRSWEQDGYLEGELQVRVGDSGDYAPLSTLKSELSARLLGVLIESAAVAKGQSDGDNPYLWEFNIFAHDPDAPALLGYLAYMLGAMGCAQAYHVPAGVFLDLAEAVREAMSVNDVPYHNFLHAFDVTQTTFCMLTTMGGRDLLQPIEVYALMLSALFHDLEHPGLNNAYHVKAGTELALRFNDQSVLENHHCVVAFSLLREHDIFAPLSSSDRRSLRKFIIDNILATDMTCHFGLTEELKKLVARRQKAASAARRGSSASAGSTSSPVPMNGHGAGAGAGAGAGSLPNGGSSPSSPSTAAAAFAWTPAERATIQKTLLHAADISNPCKPWEVSKNWSDRVIEEFFAQGDREKEAGLVVSANMDRETTHPARVAVNFTDFIVAPMFVALTSLLPPAQSCCDLLDENRTQWATLLEENIKAQASLSDEARAHQLETLERRSSAFHDVLMTIAHQSSGKTDVEADTAVVNTPKPSRRKVSRRQSLNPLAAFVINAHTTSGLDEPPTPRRQMHQLVAVAEVEVDVDIDS